MSELFGVFGLDIRLLLLHAVNFGIAMVVLWYFLYTPMLNFLDKRRQEIAEGVTKAKEAEERLQEADKEKQDIIRSAAQNAEEIVSQARQSGKEKEAAILREAEERSQRMFAEAQRAADEEKRAALEASREEIAKMVVLGAEKVLRERE
jgi:F-type H+-transporting ATPase subunit b